jgi:hypothetical protein
MTRPHAWTRLLSPLPLLLLLAALAGCGSGGDEERDITSPLLTFNGTDPGTTGRTRLLSGTVESGAELSVRVDTAATVGAIVSTPGTWECTVSNLVPGANNVVIEASDARGNLSDIGLTLLYDALSIERWVSPVAPGTLLTIGGLIDPIATPADLSVTLGTPAVLAVPGAPVVAGDRWSLELNSLAAGSSTVTVKFVHPALATPVEKSLTITVNAAAPLLTVDAITGPDAGNSFTVSGSRSSGLSVAVAAPSATVGTVTYPTDTTWSCVLSALTVGKNPVGVAGTLAGVTTAVSDLIVFDPPPAVAATSPAAGAAVAGPLAAVEATFSEAVDPATVDAVSFTLAGAGGATVSYDQARRTAVLRPATPLPARSYTATPPPTIVDLAGHPLAAPFSWSFTVN